MRGENLSLLEPGQQEQIRSLATRCGAEIAACYQCGKCSAGCPLAASMDLPPRQLMRCLQLGLWRQALMSRAPWLCANCYSCSARCPQGLPVAELMEAVRQEATRAGIFPLRRAALFSRAFLAPVRWFGRSHELSFTILYNLGSGRVFQHFRYLPAMLKGRKLRLWPQRLKQRAAIRRLMADCAKEAAPR